MVFINFIREKLEQACEVRSEDLQEENNESEARKRQHSQLIIQNKQMQAYPVDTGRKLNVYKTFRRLPRRLLNVFCTFNLRPVSTG